MVGRFLFNLAAAIALCTSTANAQTPLLAFPVDCTLGDTCFIQNYVDRDPGPGHADFGCGSLSYNNHRGTDIALHDLAAMRSGVKVLTSVAGTVRATRTDMPDILPSDPDAPDLTNRACGNAVVIDHPGGWQTRYCHLRRGSIQVASGDVVKVSDVLGQIGLSGLTEFPHLHLGLYRRDQMIDPFQPNSATTCGTTSASLWADGIGYVEGGLIDIGFSSDLPDFDTIKNGTADTWIMTPASNALVLWAHIFGGRDGDEVVFRIADPSGATVISQTVPLTRNQARLFRAVGRKRPATNWPEGVFKGQVELNRNGQSLGRQDVEINIRY